MPYKVLIVDDDIYLLNQQKLFLEAKGYTIATAVTMEEGLEFFKMFKPDIIIADLMKEHYDSGFVFCKKVKDHPEGRNVPIIMQTGAAREMGFTFDLSVQGDNEWIKVDEVLTKPVLPEELEAKIRQYMTQIQKRAMEHKKKD